MAVRHGYGKLAGTDALVFAYDTGDVKNSYKGKPTVNLATDIEPSYPDGGLSTYFTASASQTVTIDIPNYGTTEVQYTDYTNNYGGPGSGSCCPNFYRYAPNYTPVSGSTTYTYAIIYKHSLGYTTTNIMYRYEYSSSNALLTQGGVHNNSNRYELGDGWYYAWGQFTTQATTAKITAFSFLYNYAQDSRYYVAAVSITEGTEVLPPKQLLPPNGTRSNTQGLLDLTGNTTMTLESSSFDSNAQIVFDGSTTRIPITGLTISATENKSYEAIVYLNTGYAAEGNVIAGARSTTNAFQVNASRQVRGSEDDVPVTGTTQLDTEKYYHIAYTFEFDGGSTATLKVYVNGELDGTNINSSYIDSYVNSNNFIGYDSRFEARFNGKISVAKVYNRALTAAEVAQNYQHYKTRFNLG